MTALFTPMRIGTVEIRNRVIMPAMLTRLADPEGYVTDATIAYFKARAAGGTGLVIIEMGSPERVGRHRGRELGLYDDRFLPGLTRLVKAVHACGAKVALQIGHAGGHTREDICGEPPIAPSAVPYYVFDVTGQTIIPIAMTKERIAQCIEAFIGAARRARAAGFDCMELHAANGYLLSQFLCPEENRRDDEYGGSLANRARISLEILQRIKAEIPGFPVIFRLSADDFFATGLQFAEALQVAKWAATAGADAIHVTAGHYRSVPSPQIKSPPMAYPDGTFLDYAARVKAEVRVPVIAVGRLGNPAVAMAAVDSGKADFVAVGRGLIADPDWVTKAQHDRPVRRCLACNTCSDEMRGGGHVGCLVNPVAACETEFGPDLTLPKGERICVVGAGPAGLSYASLVAQFSTVTVFERESSPGGAFRYAGRVPRFQEVEANQESFDAYVRELERDCKEKGVTFRYGIDVTRTPGALNEFDRIVIATGARYRYGLGALVKLFLALDWGKSDVLRRFFSSERMRSWFYYHARLGTGKAHWMLQVPGRKVIVIGDAIRAGKAREAIASAFQAAYQR